MAEKRLIDVNVLKERLFNLEASGGHKYYRQGMDDVLHKFMPQILDDAPTVDAVEVVRCKDCKWWKDDMCTNVNGANCLVFNGDWFCCSGERKTDG